MIANPVVAYFAAAPVATRELGETFCTALFRSNGTDIEGDLRNFFAIRGAGTLDDNQASGSGQISLQRLEGVKTYPALIEASVCDVYLFGVGKKGRPSSAARWAL